MHDMFDGHARRLLDRAAFAKLALRLPTGRLQNTVMWYRAADDGLRMIAPEASVKARSLDRDPRVAVLIDDPDNPYAYVEIRGRATVHHDDRAARAELRLIASRYIGDAADVYVAALSDDPRVLIVIAPDRVRYHGGRRPGAAANG